MRPIFTSPPPTPRGVPLSFLLLVPLAAGCAHSSTRDDATRGHDTNGELRPAAASAPRSNSAADDDAAPPANSEATSGSATGAMPGANSNDAPSGRMPSGGDPNVHWLVQVRVNDGKFTVVRVTAVDKPLPRRRGGQPPNGWRYESRTGADSVTFVDYVPQPQLLRGEFLGQPTQHVHIQRSGPVDFVVRVPAHSAEVRFFDAADSAKSSPTPLGSVSLPAEPSAPESAGAR